MSIDLSIEPPKGLEITAENVVHIYDAMFPVCYSRRRDDPGPLWKVGPMVRQHSLANCPDCLDLV